YRRWSRDASGPARDGLLACAAREESIADRVAALHPGADAAQRALRTDHPELEELYHAVFAGRPLAEQFAIQATGERAGAAAWRAFAQHATGAARDTFLECAVLEEESAAYLESLLAAR